MFGNKTKEHQKTTEQLLTESITAMQGTITEMQKAQAAMPRQMAGMVATALQQAGVGRQQQAPPKEEPTQEAPQWTEEQINDMSNSEFLGVLQQVLPTMLEPVVGEIKQVKQTRETDQLRNDFEKLANRHPELAAYVPEIKQALNSNSTLTAAQAFAIAKDSVTPDRQEEVDNQLKQIEEAKGQRQTAPADGNPDPRAAQTEGEDDLTPVSFFPNPPTPAEGSDEMTPEDAGEDAWQNTFGNAVAIG